MDNNKNEKLLVVDLDNSLIKVDLFKEGLGRLILSNPSLFVKSIYLCFFDKAKAKKIVFENLEYNYDAIPYNRNVIKTIKKYTKKGYKIYLSTGAFEGHADAVYNKLGIFQGVFSTKDNYNNVGEKKLRLIQKISMDFIYVGDSKKDIPIWLYCKKAILVGENKNILKILKGKKVEILDTISNDNSLLSNIFKQIRIHQWVKNLLIFLPAITSFNIFSPKVILDSSLGFIAFSLIASSVYIINDIFDLNNDRVHNEKKSRPLASGELGITEAYSTLAICLLSGFFLAKLLGGLVFATCIVYFITTLLYSNSLKKIIILDVIVLTSFYIMRIIVGHLINNIAFSTWFISFSIFIFFSLGILKRYIDVKHHFDDDGIVAGRGYKKDEHTILLTIGLGSGLISILVMILYTGGTEVQENYSSPNILTLLTPIMIYWISRFWLLAFRGSINNDPVEFIIKDKSTFLSLFITIIIMVLARYVTVE